MSEWRPINTMPEGEPVMTKIDDAQGSRNEQVLVKRTRIPGETRPMYWTKGEEMYVYYEPTHWKRPD
jgi:hypothetical protein